MRNRNLFTYSVICLACIFIPAKAQTPSKLIDYNATTNKGAIICTAGDLIQISYPFSEEPKQLIANLRIKIEGDGLGQVGIFRVPIRHEENGPEIPGRGKIAAFFKSEKPGRPQVTITQLDQEGNPRGDPRVFKIVIGAAR